MKQAKWMIAALLMLVPVLASAQLGHGGISVEVPFAFTVGNTMVPAGTYLVQPSPSNDHTLVIRDRDGKAGLFSVASEREANTSATACSLVFARYGDRYFLRKIKVEGSRTQYQLPENKMETEFRVQNKPPAETEILASLR